MKSAGVIGWPVAHSKSPIIHRFWLSELGLDGDYGRFAVHPDRLGEAIRALPALGLAGVNVTVPHKLDVMQFLDRVDPLAEAVGAVNLVTVADDGKLEGRNTDVGGFAEPLPENLKTAVILGAGGAARAILVALRDRGVGYVTILNRSEDKARTLLQELGMEGEVRAPGQVPDADLIVNATILGMVGSPPLEADISGVGADAVVYDIVYAPLETELLRAARVRGMRTIDGLSMLIGQADEAFRYFYGAKPPRDKDAELRALLLV